MQRVVMIGMGLLAAGLTIGVAISHETSTPHTEDATTLAGGLIPYLDEAAVARGEEVYRDYCAACHGESREGQENWRTRMSNGRLPAPPQDETGHSWHHPDALLIAITTYGSAALIEGDYQTDMAGFEGILEPDDILAALAFIKAQWPDEVIAQHNRINASAAGQ